MSVVDVSLAVDHAVPHAVLPHLLVALVIIIDGSVPATAVAMLPSGFAQLVVLRFSEVYQCRLSL